MRFSVAIASIALLVEVTGFAATGNNSKEPDRNQLKFRCEWNETGTAIAPITDEATSKREGDLVITCDSIQVRVSGTIAFQNARFEHASAQLSAAELRLNPAAVGLIDFENAKSISSIRLHR